MGTCRDGAHSSLGIPCRSLATLRVLNFHLTFGLNLPSFTLKSSPPCPITVNLCEKSLSLLFISSL